MTTTTVGEVRELARDLLTAGGMPEEPAARTAWALVLAESWGARSHGLLRLPHYLRRFATGGCDPAAPLRLVTDLGAVAVYDGGNGLGHPQLWHAASVAAERAASHGVGTVAVGNSGHCGALGIYVLPMLEAGMIGLVFSNGPAAMPPWGGRTPVLSTSPLAAGLPTSPPAIVDMATSAAARGRIAEAQAAGRPLPEGWAFDADGAPTTDPATALAGMLAPMAGAKGYALALVVEALTGAMVGPHLASDVADPLSADHAGAPQRIAHLALALDAGRLDLDGCSTRRFALLGRRIADAGGRLPGEHRWAIARAPRDAPVDVAPPTVRALADSARELSVPLPTGWADAGDR
ncbi:MAG: Ldh family oxidoreductase [Acidimicrobiales bacterium]